MRNSIAWAVVCILLAFGLGACGSSSGGGGSTPSPANNPFAGSCTTQVGAAIICVDYTGSSFTSSIVQTSCSSSYQTYSPSYCAIVAIGKCSTVGQTSTNTYYNSSYTISTTSSNCTNNGGTWTSF